MSELAHITMNGNTKGKEKAYVVVGVSVYYCRKGQNLDGFPLQNSKLYIIILALHDFALKRASRCERSAQRANRWWKIGMKQH